MAKHYQKKRRRTACGKAAPQRRLTKAPLAVSCRTCLAVMERVRVLKLLRQGGA